MTRYCLPRPLIGTMVAGLVGLYGLAQAQTPATLCVLAPSAVSIDFTRQFTLPELARQGFRNGENLRFVAREAGGQAAQLPRLAVELANQRCTAVVAVSASAISAARQAMPGTPIVMGFGHDPIGHGWAVSLQRPGGQITGVSMQTFEGNLKRLEVMRDLLPRMRRLGVLLLPTVEASHRADLQTAAARLGFELAWVEAARPQDLEAAFVRMRQAKVEAVLVTSSPIFIAAVADIVRQAQAAGWPTVCEWEEMARAGCTASFGPVISELRTRVGAIAAQVLRGVQPGDIPIEQPNRFELVLNLKAARSLGVTVPAALRLRADEVIE